MTRILALALLLALTTSADARKRARVKVAPAALHTAQEPGVKRVRTIRVPCWEYAATFSELWACRVATW